MWSILIKAIFYQVNCRDINFGKINSIIIQLNSWNQLGIDVSVILISAYQRSTYIDRYWSQGHSEHNHHTQYLILRFIFCNGSVCRYTNQGGKALHFERYIDLHQDVLIVCTNRGGKTFWGVYLCISGSMENLHSFTGTSSISISPEPITTYMLRVAFQEEESHQ